MARSSYFNYTTLIRWYTYLILYPWYCRGKMSHAFTGNGEYYIINDTDIAIGISFEYQAIIRYMHMIVSNDILPICISFSVQWNISMVHSAMMVYNEIFCHSKFWATGCHMSVSILIITHPANSLSAIARSWINRSTKETNSKVGFSIYIYNCDDFSGLIQCFAGFCLRLLGRQLWGHGG